MKGKNDPDSYLDFHWYHICLYVCEEEIEITLNPTFFLNSSKLILNDLLGGRGWWLVKGALVRGPFLFPLKTF